MKRMKVFMRILVTVTMYCDQFLLITVAEKKQKVIQRLMILIIEVFKWEKQLLIPLTIYQHSFWQPLLCYFMRMAWGWQIWHTGWQKIWRTYCTPYNCIKYKLFSSFFHSQNLEKIYTNAVTKDPTTPQMCCYTTLWNVSVLKATIENKASVTINFMKLTTGNNVVFCLSYCLK